MPTSFDCKIYQLAPKEQEALEEFLKEHQEKKYIEPSKSPYASSFFFVKKKDGKLWPVQDYRQLNEWTILNNYSLPLIRDIIPCLAGKKHLTSVDVCEGYNNILIWPEDRHKAAFKTNKGFFQPKVMYFGMWNASATFQSMIDTGGWFLPPARVQCPCCKPRHLWQERMPWSSPVVIG